MATNTTDMATSSVTHTASVVGMAVLKLFVAGLLGTLSIHKLKEQCASTNLVRDLSVLNKEIFIPCMIFGACAQGITLELLDEFAVVPLLMAGFICVGVVAGIMVTTLTPLTA